MKQDITESVYYAERDGRGEWPPAGLLEFANWLAQKIEEVPEQYRADAEIFIDTESVYEDRANPDIHIYYLRPETDEEEAAREARREEEMRQRAEHEQARERAEFERLKRKFGE